MNEKTILDLLDELNKRVNYLLSELKAVQNENDRLRGLFVFEEGDALPTISECNDIWNTVITKINILEQKNKILEEKDPDWLKKYQNSGTYL